MLLELVVENYAVVDRLRVRFHAGLNLLTGETGSGKSIVVDALGLLFGGRASTDMIRSGETRARVAGIFEAPAGAAAVLEAAGFAAEDGEILVEREIQANGKSRAFVGSRPAAVSLLRDLAPHLGDIHGQHDQQLLFLPDAQRALLDAFGETREPLAKVRELYRRWRAIDAELESVQQAEQEKLRLLDMWSFQRKEIEGARLEAGEDASLEAERRVLQNVNKLEEAASAAYAAVYDSPESASTLLRQALKRVDDLCRIDPGLEPVRENLKNAEMAAAEAAYGLRDYLSGLEANPGRLEEVESRLAALDKLKRKYGADIAEILAFLDQVTGQIHAVETSGERMEQLRRERAEVDAAYEEAAGALTAARKETARRLEKMVEKELSALAMERTVFRIAVQPHSRSENGADAIAFLVSPNQGEEPRPLEKVASGGEISRIALALKTCLAGKPPSGPQRTLVFDEVDTGIGGGAAEGVGRRLKKLAAASQVLCVTHLPQIAGFADAHYRVEKKAANGRTVAAVEELDAEGRRAELGRMLSGQTVTPEALKQAEQLIRMAR